MRPPTLPGVGGQNYIDTTALDEPSRAREQLQNQQEQTRHRAPTPTPTPTQRTVFVFASSSWTRHMTAVAVGLQGSGSGGLFSNAQADGGVGANLDPVERARERGRLWPTMARRGSGVLPRHRHEWMKAEHRPRLWPSDLGAGLRAKVRDLLATTGPDGRLEQHILDVLLDEAHGELRDFCLSHDKIAEEVQARRAANGNDSLWGTGPAAIYRALRRLEGVGWITRRYRRLPGAGARVVTEFRIHIAPHALAKWHELLRRRQEAKKNRGKGGGRTTPPKKNPGDRPWLPAYQPDDTPKVIRPRVQDGAGVAAAREQLKGKGWRARDG